MIGNRIINKLNNLGIGIDIDKLETEVIDFKQAQMISTLSINNRNHLDMVDLLKALKPYSVAFKEQTLLKEIDSNYYNEYLIKYPNILDNIYYKNTKEFNIQSNKIDVTVNQIGIDISIIYLSGSLSRIYCIGLDKRYIDLTDRLRDKLPVEIDDYFDYSVVDIRAVLHKDGLNECDVLHNIRLNKKLEGFTISCYKAYSDVDIELSRKLNLCKKYSLEEVTKDNIKEALNEIIKTLDSKNYYLRINNTSLYKYNEFDSNTIFSSTVIDIIKENTYEGIKISLKIIPIYDINRIDNVDIIDISNNGIKIGSKIKFNIFNNKAYIIKSTNK